MNEILENLDDGMTSDELWKFYHEKRQKTSPQFQVGGKSKNSGSALPRLDSRSQQFSALCGQQSGRYKVQTPRRYSDRAVIRRHCRRDIPQAS